MDKTLSKGLLILEVLASAPAPVGVAELARELELTKSNVHRLLQTLVACGYVVGADGKYSAGLKAWQVGSQIISRLDLRNVARPLMENLAGATAETVHLSVLDGNLVLYVDKIDSPQPVRAYSEIAGHAPAHCVATGKVLLAYKASGETARQLADLERFTAKTIVDPRKFAAELEVIRNQGYAINKGEWRDKVCGIAAPILDSRNQVVAALGISGPADRLSAIAMRKFVPIVCDAAASVSTAMGAAKRF